LTIRPISRITGGKNRPKQEIEPWHPNGKPRLRLLRTLLPIFRYAITYSSKKNRMDPRESIHSFAQGNSRRRHVNLVDMTPPGVLGAMLTASIATPLSVVQLVVWIFDFQQQEIFVIYILSHMKTYW